MNLVVGATGFLGREICRRLEERGEPVRALVRPGSPRRREVTGGRIEIVHGDLKQPSTLVAACRGARTVISTATCTTFRRGGDTLETVDRDGQIALVDAARESGVERFVYVSVDPGLPDSIPFVCYKRQVERAIRESGMTWTILKPGPFMEIHLGSTLGWSVEKGTARIVGSGDVPASYISLHDVAAFVLRAIHEPRFRNRDLPLAGPAPVSPNEALAIFEELTGRRFRVQRMPILMLHVLSVVMRPFNPVLSSLMGLGAAAAGVPAIDMRQVLEEFPTELVSVRDYVERLAGTANR